MKAKKISYTFDYPIADVFSKINAALYLDLNEKSKTLNTSYAQPVGTKFHYQEKSFGQDVTYTAEITEYKKPLKIAFKLSEDATETDVNIFFKDLGSKTEVTYVISLKNANFLQRFFKRNHLEAWIKRFEGQAKYATKTLTRK